MNDQDQRFMLEAIELARKGHERGEGTPFGCVIVKGGQVVGRGHNRVAATHDPTTHAEMEAIRAACRHLRQPTLAGCTVYASGEPCPMCLAALYVARPTRVVYGASHAVAAKAGFSTAFVRDQLALAPEDRTLRMEHLHMKEADALFTRHMQ